MNTTVRIFVLSTIIALLLSACSLFSDPGGSNTAINPNPPVQPVTDMSMSVTYDTNITYNTVGQVVNFSYLIGNTSSAPIPGPVTVIDDRVTGITCPDLSLVGDNRDNNLDTNEAITCSGTYAITQLDLNAGSFKNTATASAGGKSSAAIATTVALNQARALALTKSADPTVFNNAGENIIYSYEIKNSGNVTLGPAQFKVTDDKIDVDINCGGDATTLEPQGTVSCSATYITTDADVTARLVTNNASATDGTTTSNTISATINRGNVVNPSDLTPGTTIRHKVVKGEWLWQIARCYGADPKQVIQANPQLANPAKISPDIIVSVPNIGAGGRIIFGPPCVEFHTVLAGDTWASIAQLYNADAQLLQEVNPGILSPGRILKVPSNSTGTLGGK